MPLGTDIVYRPSSYTGEVSSQHIPALMADADETLVATQKYTQRVSYGRTPNDFNESLAGLHCWGQEVSRAVPAGVDLALDVDDGGITRRRYEPLTFSHWAESDVPGVYLRFAESRTARHGLGLLRTPIMGGGIALEATVDPESVDIRDAHTMFIIEAERGEDANYPWAHPHPARLFDVRI